MDDLSAIAYIATAVAIPALFGFALGREFPRCNRAREHRLGAALISLIEGVHFRQMMAGECAISTTTSTIHTPGKPDLLLLVTSKVDA